MSNYVISQKDSAFKYVLNDPQEIANDVRFLLKNGATSITIEKEQCPRWKNLPNNDCSECPNTDETCIMIAN